MQPSTSRRARLHIPRPAAEWLIAHGITTALAAQIIRAVRADREAGHPEPPEVTDLIRALLDPPTLTSCDIATDSGPAETMEIGTREMAARMGCSEQYVRRLAAAGRIPRARKTAGGWWVFVVEEGHGQGHADREVSSRDQGGDSRWRHQRHRRRIREGQG